MRPVKVCKGRIDAAFDRREKIFEQTVRGYSADLYRLRSGCVATASLPKTFVQETFVRAWNAWDKLRDRAVVKSWLISILRNEHARLYERKRFDYVDDQPEDLAIAAEHDPIALFEIEQLIGELPLSLREPFLLQTLGGFSCAEIATMIETSEGAVMVRLTRARQTLRGLLKGEDAPARRERK